MDVKGLEREGLEHSLDRTEKRSLGMKDVRFKNQSRLIVYRWQLHV